MDKTNTRRANELGQLLAEIGEVTGTGAVYHGLYDHAFLRNDRLCGFCRFSLNHPATRASCRYACCDATMHSLSSGEPYFYRCWAGLLFVTVAVAPGNRCLGGIALGGFIAADTDESVDSAIRERLTALPEADHHAFLAHRESLRTITSSALRGFGMYALDATFSSGINSASFFRKQNEKYMQQRKIAEAHAELRLHNPTPPELPGDAYQFLAHLRGDDRQSAMQDLSTYLARLLLFSNWDLTRLKAHLRVLLAVVTSQDILNGMSWEAASAREMRCLGRLEAAATTEDSCYEIAEFIKEHFRESRYDDAVSGTVAERATRWLEHHYQGSATLEEAARAIGVSVSTLVHQLKEETDQTYGQLRMEIRLAQARKLLATSSLEISEIAAVCGFFDQSHFTRCLKRATNLTPRRFRNLLHPTSRDIVVPVGCKAKCRM